MSSWGPIPLKATQTGPTTASKAAIHPPGVRVLPAVRELRYRVLRHPGTSRSREQVRGDVIMAHPKVVTTSKISNANQHILRRYLSGTQINLNKLLCYTN